MQREVLLPLLLPFPILLVRLWPVHTAPSQSLLLQLCCLSFFLCLSSFCVCASQHHLLLFLIATSSSSSTWFLCSSSFCITVCLLPSFLPWCSGADRDCIETGRRNWLPSLFSWNTRSREQGCTGSVSLELLRVAGASLAMSWHTGARRGPEKLARVQWRLNLQRTGLPYFTELSVCNNIPPLLLPCALTKLECFSMGIVGDLKNSGPGVSSTEIIWETVVGIVAWG